MAGNGQSKAQKQRERVGPSVDSGKASRVSKAAGGTGSQDALKVSVEQRSNVPATKPRASAQGSSKRGQSSSRGSKKGSSSQRPNPAAPPADSRVIKEFRHWWQNMETHQQQRVYSSVLLVLSLILIASLTFFRTSPLLSGVNKFFLLFFGWSAYPLAFGLFIFAIAHLIEGTRRRQVIRWSLVVGLVVLWLFVLAESQLLFKGTTGGVLGGLLANPLLGLGGIGHVLLIGMIAIVAIVTFRITLGRVLMVTRFIGKAISTGGNKSLNGNTGGPSPYLGQRPQYSRYGNASPGLAGRRGVGSVNGDEDKDDEVAIDFDADFEDDDPLNDINIHKKQVGMAPHGARPAQPLNREQQQDIQAAVQGAHQPPLPFNQGAQSGRSKNGANNGSKSDLEMEPLAPNPLLKKISGVFNRGGNANADSAWKLADTSMLNNPEEVKIHMFGDDTSSLAKVIQETLRSFRVDAEVRAEDISIGPTVIRFGIRPTGRPEMKVDEKGRQVPVKDAAGNIVYETRTRVSRIMALQNDLALVLEAKSIRMEAPVPGRPYVGVEIPNKNSRLVTLREVLESKEYLAAKAKSKLAVALGKDVAGAVRVGDLARMPHLLIAGATGAGKSVCLNAIIASILTQATPEDVRMLMVDPKMVELNMYNGIPHLLSPVVIEVEKVVGLLKVAIAEMERRYRTFSQLGVRNLDGYRKLRHEKMAHGDNTLKNLPAIVIIIDELADLMMAAPEEVEGLICRLAQLARATGIHLIIATQRPSVDVITGLIKANIPTRISFMVSSAVDSRTIIDMGGAERLLGRGDMLYLPADAGKPERIQGAFVADDEAERLVMYWRQQAAEHAAAMAAANQGNGNAGDAAPVQPAVEPGWEVKDHVSDDFELEDDLLEQAEEVVREYERASISLLQRRLRIGYSRAARLIDLLEERGIIGPSESGGRSREVLEGGPGPSRHGARGGEGRTLADEAADIIAEEKSREEFLRRQSASGRIPNQGYGSAHGTEDNEHDM